MELIMRHCRWDWHMFACEGEIETRLKERNNNRIFSICASCLVPLNHWWKDKSHLSFLPIPLALTLPSPPSSSFPIQFPLKPLMPDKEYCVVPPYFLRWPEASKAPHWLFPSFPTDFSHHFPPHPVLTQTCQGLDVYIVEKSCTLGVKNSMNISSFTLKLKGVFTKNTFLCLKSPSNENGQFLFLFMEYCSIYHQWFIHASLFF